MKALRTLLVVVLLLLPAVASAAPTLSWDTVTTDTTGAALGSGLEIKSYDVYRCPVNVNPCTAAAGTKIGSVTAASPIVPRQSLDLAGQASPANFCVVAVNIIAPSAESLTLKATPGDRPKNVQVN